MKIVFAFLALAVLALAQAKTDPYKAEISYDVARVQLKLGQVQPAQDRLYRIAVDS